MLGLSHQLHIIEEFSCVGVHHCHSLVDFVSSLANCRVSLHSHLVLYRSSTAAACPGCGLIGVLVGRWMQDALLLGLVLAAGGDAAVTFALFLALVLHAGVYVSTGVAARVADFPPNRTHRVDFNVG